MFSCCTEFVLLVNEWDIIKYKNGSELKFVIAGGFTGSVTWANRTWSAPLRLAFHHSSLVPFAGPFIWTQAPGVTQLHFMFCCTKRNSSCTGLTLLRPKRFGFQFKASHYLGYVKCVQMWEQENKVISLNWTSPALKEKQHRKWIKSALQRARLRSEQVGQIQDSNSGLLCICWPD